MRPIKFRAWDKVNKKMIYYSPLEFLDEEDGYDIVAINKNEDISDRHYVDSHRSKSTTNKMIVMQYTGLKDKNGKEVYEGDIIKFKGLCGGHHIKEVKWDKNTGFYPFTVCSYPRLGYECGADIKRGTVEVIGNIWENKELME